jgi:hypothetical protein
VDDENEKVHIKAYIPDYDSDSKKREAIAWLYLDHVLGEFNSITKLGHVSFENLDQEIEGSVNIIELRKIIDSELYGAST